MPKLAEIRCRIASTSLLRGRLCLREVVGDVGVLHENPVHSDAVFQVASQFNVLEMVDPNVTPAEGITGYIYDRTQGPTCALAAAGGTLYRNYWVPLDGVFGQTGEVQVDCLADFGRALGNDENDWWIMRNGYVIPNSGGLEAIDAKLESMTASEQDALRGELRVGVQWDTEVTRNDAGHTVNQVYGSALPVAYSQESPAMWARFATLILEASYEATFGLAALHAAGGGSNQLFLTRLGGGAFGNADSWIHQGLLRSLHLFADVDLDVALVSYGQSQPSVSDLVDRWQAGNNE
ncbi:MAG TPA: hypothetical protein QF761_14645 [Pirellulales bacterium]|nr:hypothetical protein [Pirellulales bacterium]